MRTISNIVVVSAIPGLSASSSPSSNLFGSNQQVKTHGTAVDPTVTGYPVPSTVESTDSIAAMHPTTFEDFQVTAIPTYNFFVPNEAVAPYTGPTGNLADVPRYITVSWRAPSPPPLSDSQKGQKFVAPITRSVTSVDFSTAVASAVNGYIAPGTVSTLLVSPIPTPPPVPPISEDEFLLDSELAGERAAVIRASALDRPKETAVTLPQEIRTRVDFVDPSIIGAFHPNRIAVATDKTHLAMIGSLAKVAAGLEIISEFNQDVQTRNAPPSFPENPTVPALRYVGYILERHDHHPDGSMVLGNRILIDDVMKTSFIDTTVLYGTDYSYRIRAVLMWTRPSDLTFYGKSTLNKSTSQDQVISLKSYVTSCYLGQWSDWGRSKVIDDETPSPPDELRVAPRSNKGLIRISWKMPLDDRSDLKQLVLVRRSRVSPRWKALGVFPVGNGAYDDLGVVDYETSNDEYTYAMYSMTTHNLLSVLSPQITAKVTSEWKRLGEYPVVLHSQAGVRVGVPAVNMPVDLETTLVADRSLKLYCRRADSDMSLDVRRYVLRVISLSTGETTQVSFLVDSVDVDHVPQHRPRMKA